MSEAPPATPGVFSSRTVAWLLGVGVSAFIGLVVLGAYAPELREGQDGRGHALSRSAVGFAGLVKLLRELGTPVVVTRGPRPAVAGPPGLLILTPPAGTKPQALRALARAAGPTLIILPKWIAAPDIEHPGWVREVGLAAPKDALSSILERVGSVDLDPPLARLEGSARVTLHGVGREEGVPPLTTGPIVSLQTDLPGRAMTLLADDAGRPILYALDPRTFVLTEPDLLNDQGLRSEATAAAGVAIIDRLRSGGPVVFDVTLSGLKRSRSLLRLALGPPFLGATLCALAAALLMGAHAAIRFGPIHRPERAFALGKAALVDNTAVLIARAKREARMGGRYAALTRRNALRGLIGERDLAPEQADAALDRLTPAGEPPFSRLAADAEKAPTAADALAAARALHHRVLEMTRERL